MICSFQNSQLGVPVVAQCDQWCLCSAWMQIWSPAQQSGLKILMLPQLWHRLHLWLRFDPPSLGIHLPCWVAAKKEKEKKILNLITVTRNFFCGFFFVCLFVCLFVCFFGHTWHVEVPRARDQTCVRAATQATIVTMLDSHKGISELSLFEFYWVFILGLSIWSNFVNFSINIWKECISFL